MSEKYAFIEAEHATVALEPAPASAARQARPGLARAAADVTPPSPSRGLSVPSVNAGL